MKLLCMLCSGEPLRPLQGLQWMLDREQKGYALERGHLHLPPAWLQLRAADGQRIYVSLIAPYRITTDFVTAPAGGTCGGDQLRMPLHYTFSCWPTAHMIPQQ